MFKKTASAVALAGTLAFASTSVQAREVRPATVKLDTQRVEAVGADVRATTRSRKESKQAMTPLVIGLLAIGAIGLGVAVAAGDSPNTSPN